MIARPLRSHAATAATLATLLLLGGAGAIPVSAGGGRTVEIADFAFSPQTLTIAVGDTVTWTNADPVVHTATSTSGAFDSGDLDQGESFSYTFTLAGTYDYLCAPHPTMVGRIVVQAAAAAPTVAPSIPAGGGLPNVAMAAPTGPALAATGAALLLVAGGLAVAVARRRRAIR